jgi:sulfonate transport system substrate-binding protein
LATVGAAQVLVTSAFAQGQQFTDWGWPTPYDKVSQKSLDWLKQRGWLPLSIGFFADLPG